MINLKGNILTFIFSVKKEKTRKILGYFLCEKHTEGAVRTGYCG